MGPYKFKKPRDVELSANVADWAPAMYAACLLRPDEQTLFGGFGTSASGQFCCKTIFGPGAKNTFPKSSPKREF
jgi:hypothetical protein